MALNLQKTIKLYFGPRIKGLWKNSRRAAGHEIEPPRILGKYFPKGYLLDFSNCSPREVRNFMRRAVRQGEIDQQKLTRKYALKLNPSSQNLWNKTQLGSLAANYANSSFFNIYMRLYHWTAPVTALVCAKKAEFSNRKVNILDVGCHEGNLLTFLKLAREMKDYPYDLNSYIGIDFSISAIRTARKTYPNQKFICGDALDLESYRDIPDNSQNLIFCVGVCDYLVPRQIKILLTNLKRKLSPDGKIIITYRTSYVAYNINNPQPVQITAAHFTEHSEDEIQFLSFEDGWFTGLRYNVYKPEDFRDVAKKLKLKINTNASLSWPADKGGHKNAYDFVVLEHDGN